MTLEHWKRSVPAGTGFGSGRPDGAPDAVTRAGGAHP